MLWKTTRFEIDLSQPKVMGIVNVTPDSFSDGGRYSTEHAAMAHCESLLADGAHILDIGGESTRPGATQVALDEELSRVLPVVRHAVTLGVPVSVDTYKPAVMQAALDAGVDIVNDVWALRWRAQDSEQTGAQVVAQHGRCGVSLMHMHREPQTMQLSPMQDPVIGQVTAFLAQSARQLCDWGVDKSRICLDPGIGFGKTVAQNFELLAKQAELVALGYPLLLGWSRKSSLVAVTQTSLSSVASMNAQDRLVPSVSAALIAVQRGAHIVRVHDVKETVQALKVWAAVQGV
jgi:dihydropteroate synthase